ncbi:MAG: hypothetical protein H7145_08500 [Akkermansiaceae bacterium]|nr:hypothetical protein [Armatimonadota bacterium]
MQTTLQHDTENIAPRPKIDPADALTVVPRLLAGFFLGGLAIMYVVAQNWGMVAFLGFASGLMLYWGFRLINKMRRENVEYIAYRAAEEAAARATRKANR